VATSTLVTVGADLFGVAGRSVSKRPATAALVSTSVFEMVCCSVAGELPESFELEWLCSLGAKLAAPTEADAGVGPVSTGDSILATVNGEILGELEVTEADSGVDGEAKLVFETVSVLVADVWGLIGAASGFLPCTIRGGTARFRGSAANEWAGGTGMNNSFGKAGSSVGHSDGFIEQSTNLPC
jgi:hypothetical protein